MQGTKHQTPIRNRWKPTIVTDPLLTYDKPLDSNNYLDSKQCHNKTITLAFPWKLTFCQHGIQNSQDVQGHSGTLWGPQKQSDYFCLQKPVWKSSKLLPPPPQDTQTPPLPRIPAHKLPCHTPVATVSLPNKFNGTQGFKGELCATQLHCQHIYLRFRNTRWPQMVPASNEEPKKLTQGINQGQ